MGKILAKSINETVMTKMVKSKMVCQICGSKKVVVGGYVGAEQTLCEKCALDYSRKIQNSCNHNFKRIKIEGETYCRGCMSKLAP